MDNRDAPIGIFDSGVGGLTVFAAIRARLPNENLIYLGDTARIPYGTRSADTVQRYAAEDAAFVCSAGVKLVIVACNTASALAGEQLAKQSSVPVVDVIRPGARQAVARTRNRRIGVIGTEATVSSGAYERMIRTLDPEVEVHSRACPLFVPLAEEGWIDHEVTRLVAHEYLAELRAINVDTLVMGCTHYPLLRATIERVLGNDTAFVDSGEAVANEVWRLLEEGNARRQGKDHGFERFYVTDSTSRFRRVAEQFLGRTIEHVEKAELGGA